MKLKSLAFLPLVLSIQSLIAQPKYTPKHLVVADNINEFVRISPTSDGAMKNYLIATLDIWDTDDNDTSFVVGGQTVLLCIEGYMKNNQRNGLFTGFLIDSLNHKKRYKIWEKTYVNNKLNGKWKTFSLDGKLVNFQTFKNDSLRGIAKNYAVNGKTILEEREYYNGQGNYVLRKFSKSGELLEETSFKNDIANGLLKKYYPSKVLKETMTLKDGVANGIQKSYYSNGRLGIELEFKNGYPWNIISNYTAIGQKRNPGNLKNGNGTIINYNKNGSVDKIVNYVNGMPATK